MVAKGLLDAQDEDCEPEGIHGSHHIYVHANIPELLNLQNVNGQAKPYQVKQLLRLIERYNLQMEDGT
jgi:hypothetical protein